MRPRQIAPVALVLGLTLAGFFGARLAGERDARRDSRHRAEIAAAQIRDRLAQAASLTESLRRFMLDASGTGVTSDQFTRNASWWLSPAGFQAAAWVEEVPDSRRAAYERRIGQPIVTPDDRRTVRSRPTYLPATLVSGFHPMALPGTDLSGQPGMPAALARATGLDGAAATAIAAQRSGTSGLFLVAPAPNLVGGLLHPGYVAVFVSEPALRDAATEAPAVRIAAAGTSSDEGEGANTATRTFTVAGQRFDVSVPRESVTGAPAALPWLVLAAGLVLAALAAALGVNRARRARAQQELDRIFTLSADLIAVADFDGHFTRVNPAVEKVLGYTAEEFLARPYLDLVHPDDRERTAAEAAAIGHGKTTLAFENRYLRKDGSYRVLEWTSSPVVEDGVMYGVARDVTERREAATELERLAGEQAALRRVATLVAGDAPQAEVFAAIAKEIAQLLGAQEIRMWRYEDDRSALIVAAWGQLKEDAFPIGSRHRLEGGSAGTRVLQTGRPARLDDYAGASGPIAAMVRAAGGRSVVAAPIVVEGRLWGAMTAATTPAEPMPPDTESRLGQFTGLMASAIANAESHDRASGLAEEQAALRRVATLVARGSEPEPVFRAVADEAGALLGCDTAAIVRFEPDGAATVMGAHQARRTPGTRFEPDPDYVVAAVRDTGKAARFDTDDPAAAGMSEPVRAEGIRSGLASPIVVDGELWGTITVASLHGPLPARTERRLADFTELVATAISNTQAREDLHQLADEQAALRRVATLVAREASQEEVFAAIAQEIGQLLGSDEIRMLRYDGDRSAVVVASSGHQRAFPVGSRQSMEGDTASSRVLRTGQTARIDNYETATGPQAGTARSIGIRSAIGAPILVEGRLWGAIVMGMTLERPLPSDTEVRLGRFTALMATAIANADARTEADRLAAEQAALRRVATLVAKESPPAEVLATVAEELANALGDADCSVFRDEGDGTATLIAVWGAALSAGVEVGSRWPLDGTGVIASVLREGRPSRVADYSAATGALARDARERLGIRSAVGCPIVVRGRVWGALGAARYEPNAFPPESERWVAQFAELAATAIVNAEARAQVERLAEEQAALRRVATLVAEGAAPTVVLDAVAAEMERLLGADGITLSRYESHEEVTLVAHRGSDPRRVPMGTRVSHQGENVPSLVRRTERSARMEHQEGSHGAIAELARASGVRESVGAPIVVDGRLWGVAVATWRGDVSPPADTEERMAKFAELLDTAIANADSRDQLNASRARLLTAGDEARRRVVRDLHDGAQQRLVHTVVTLKLAQRALREENGRTESLIGEALRHAEQGNAELRELVHGILPAVLTRGGLRAGVNSLVARLDLPVQVDVRAERFSAEIEASAYFIVAEALTNVVKHAHASRAEVTASVGDGTLRVEVRDDGRGGADPGGHGLVGLGDRATALGGRLDIESPPGGGTLVAATLPLATG